MLKDLDVWIATHALRGATRMLNQCPLMARKPTSRKNPSRNSRCSRHGKTRSRSTNAIDTTASQCQYSILAEASYARPTAFAVIQSGPIKRWMKFL